MFSTGIFLAGLRLNEPFFKYLIKKFCLNCIGELLDPVGESFQTKTLSTFLASSLNVELVHIILKGIKKFQDERVEAAQPVVPEGTSRQSENYLRKVEEATNN